MMGLTIPSTTKLPCIYVLIFILFLRMLGLKAQLETLSVSTMFLLVLH